MVRKFLCKKLLRSRWEIRAHCRFQHARLLLIASAATAAEDRTANPEYEPHDNQKDDDLHKQPPKKMPEFGPYSSVSIVDASDINPAGAVHFAPVLHLKFAPGYRPVRELLMSLSYDEKAMILSMFGDEHVRWLEGHYAFFKMDLTKLESDVYANVPEGMWSMGYIDCLWAYILTIQNNSTTRQRGAGNDNSWFLDPYRRLPVKYADTPPLPRLPTVKFHPLKKVSRFRQWQSEREFCAILPDLYRLPD